jgi:succinoglycan biosynthesis transport protein ExoP
MGDFDFRFYLSLFLQRLPYFVTIVGVVTVVGFGITYVLPPVYQATAKILVESPQIPTELARSTVPTNAIEQFQIIEQDVMSRKNLVALADRFGVYADRKGLTPSDIATDMATKATVEQMRFDGGQGGGAAIAFAISFKSGQPTVAANVVNEIVSMILAKDVELRTGRATETLTFFTNEVARLDGELKGLETAILNFKNENTNALPDSLDFRRNRQITQQERLLLLAQEEASLRKRRADAELRGRVLDGPATPEQKSLDQLQQVLVEQLAIFSEDSPGIKALRARITALQADVRAKPTAVAASADSNHVPTEMDLELASINDRLGAIAQEKASIAKEFDSLSASILATPSNETTLNSMLRNQMNVQAQYNSAITRLAEASTGKQIEIRLKGERLSLIESAIPPTKPISPNRLMLSIGTIAAALVLGFGSIVLMELLNKSVRRPVELVQKLDIRPLITIPYITTSGELQRQRLTSVFTVVAIGGLIPVLFLLFFHSYVTPVDVLVNRALGGFVSVAR